jgi:hypothetical protein
MEDQNALTTSVSAGGALVPIAALSADIATVQSVIEENLGVGGMSEFDLQRIKMPSSDTPFYTVTDLDGEKPAKTIRCIILFTRDVRGYWKGAIDETGGGTPPDCHSNDCKTGTGTPGGVCMNCPLNEFGSASKGAGKGCKEVKQLFLLREGSDSVLPEVFAVPPTSLKAIKKYGLMLGGRGVSFGGVITEIGLAKGQSQSGQKYSQATFKPVRTLTADELTKVKAFAEMYRPLIQAAIPITAQDATGTHQDPAF